MAAENFDEWFFQHGERYYLRDTEHDYLKCWEAATELAVKNLTSANKPNTPLLFNCPPICDKCNRIHKPELPCEV